MDADTYFVLRIPMEVGMEWVNMNDRRGWQARWRMEQRWQAAAAFQLGKLAHPLPRPLPPCTIISTFIVKAWRGRDPMNFAPTIKPIVDVLSANRRLTQKMLLVADAKAHCWPDDTANWIHVREPRIHVNRESPRGVIIRAVPKER